MKRIIACGVALLVMSTACGGEATTETTRATSTTAQPVTTAASATTAEPITTTTTPPSPTTYPPATSAVTTTLAGAGATIALPEAGTTHLVIVNVTIITATGDDPIVDGVVVVEDGRITAVGPSSRTDVPDDAAVFDADGGYVMPGLIDTHTHLLNEIVLNGTELDGLRAGIHLETPLSTGLTTFRDVGSDYGDGSSLADLRTAWDNHDELLPTLVVAGPLITRGGSEFTRQFATQAATGVETPDQAAAVTDMLIDNGVDQIKIVIDENLRGIETVSLDADHVAAITTAAHARGIWVTAHVSTESEAWLALDNGVDGLAHWPGSEPLSDELIDAIAAAGAPVATTFEVIPAAHGDLRRMLDAGVRVVLGTDAPGAASAVAAWRELDAMVFAGASPMEAILASTRDAAYAVGLLDEIGTIEVGKTADLLVLTADPLADVTALSDVAVVIKHGVIVE